MATKEDRKEITIQVKLKDCRKCPYNDQKLTKGFGYAVDYFCTLSGNKVTSGYVEWESDVNPIPLWCPIRSDAEEIAKKEKKEMLDQISGAGI